LYPSSSPGDNLLTPLQPVGGSPSADGFFQEYLAAPLIFTLYLGWKIYSALSSNPKVNYRGWKLFLRANEIDIWTGIRPNILLTEKEQAEKREARAKMTVADRILHVPKAFLTSLVI
jgi:yeast amino acid transporter